MDIGSFLIEEEKTLMEAMNQLDQVAKKVLFVTREGRFVAAVTDGDIRRWILKKGSLEARVKDIANYSPVYVYEKDRASAKEIMIKQAVEAIPVLNEAEDIVSVILWNDEEIDVKRNLKVPVVIMAGGQGKRLYPYTKVLPKPLIPIGEIPIIEHILNRFHQFGCDDFYLIVNHKKNMIKAYLNEIEKTYRLHYAEEEQPLGTGGGLCLLKGRISSAFILTNCDILIDEDYEQIYDYHVREGNLITMVCSLRKVKIPYGVIEINDKGEIVKIIEKPEISLFTNTGLYIVDAGVIDSLEDGKARDFPDIIREYMNSGARIGIYPISDNAWLDMGQPEELEAMRRRLENDSK